MTPWTAVALDGKSSVFAAAARDPVFASGVWPINTPEFHLESLDVDGAVRKTVALASTTDLPDAGPVEPPSLRNDGIALVHSGRAAALHARMASATASYTSQRRWWRRPGSGGRGPDPRLPRRRLGQRLGHLSLVARSAGAVQRGRLRHAPSRRRAVERRGVPPGQPHRGHRALHPRASGDLAGVEPVGAASGARRPPARESPARAGPFRRPCTRTRPTSRNPGRCPGSASGGPTGSGSALWIWPATASTSRWLRTSAPPS